MPFQPGRLEQVAVELASRPGHEKVRWLVSEVLVSELGVDSTYIDFELPMPEVRGRADALLGRTVFEFKKDLRREQRAAEEELTRYLSDRQTQTGSPSQGQVTQDISTVAGAAYTVSFALSGNPSCTPGNLDWVGWVSEPGLKTLIVSATGAASASYSFDTTGISFTNMGWTPQTYTFTATGPVSTLSFQNAVSQWCGATIDAVTVSGGPTANVPTSADQCKKDGWRTLTDANGTAFKNQGDCVSYIATNGKNVAAGTR